MLDVRAMLFGVAAAIAPFVATTGTTGAHEHSYILATGTTGGTYYAVGVAIAALINDLPVAGDHLEMSAISSGGSVENIHLMRDGRAQFSILQGLVGRDAVEGRGYFESEERKEWLFSIASLWPQIDHWIVANEFAHTGTIQDLEGLRGMPFSIVNEYSGSAILARLGIANDDLDIVYQSYSDSSDGLQSGSITGAYMSGGVPITLLTQAFHARSNLRILRFTDEQIASVNSSSMPIWTPFTIETGSYPGLDEDIVTIAQSNFLAVHGDVSEEMVYDITRALFDKMNELADANPVMNFFNPRAALNGLSIPIHPGAVRFYTELGIDPFSYPNHCRRCKCCSGWGE